MMRMATVSTVVCMPAGQCDVHRRSAIVSSTMTPDVITSYVTARAECMHIASWRTLRYLHRQRLRRQQKFRRRSHRHARKEAEKSVNMPDLTFSARRLQHGMGRLMLTNQQERAAICTQPLTKPAPPQPPTRSQNEGEKCVRSTRSYCLSPETRAWDGWAHADRLAGNSCGLCTAADRDSAAAVATNPHAKKLQSASRITHLIFSVRRLQREVDVLMPTD
jgi:hypothetical protein